MNKRQHATGGYTLLELSVVLVIVALVTGSGLALGLAQFNKMQYAVTVKRMEAIEQAIMGFRKANGYIVCPSIPTYAEGAAEYGQEENNGKCNSSAIGNDNNFGSVPVRDLGLPDEYMYDGWGNRFSYSVYTKFADAGFFLSTPITDNSFWTSVADTNYTAGNDTTFSMNNMYVLVSHGPNGHGAYQRSGVPKSSGSTNIYELENCACDSDGNFNGNNSGRFYIGDIKDSGTDSFDDIVVFKNRAQMAGPTE